MKSILHRPSPATVISLIALFVALGGTAWALSANSVKSKHIKDGQVKSVDVLDDGLTGTDIQDGSVTPPKLGELPAVRVGGPAVGPGACALPTISNATETPLAFRDETFDNAGMHSGDPCNAGPPHADKLFATRAGVYAVSAGVIWDGVGGGSRQLIVRAYPASGIPYLVAAEQIPASPTSSQTIQNVSGLVKLDQGEFVIAHVYHDGGGNRSIVDGPDPRNFFAMHWVGP